MVAVSMGIVVDEVSTAVDRGFIVGRPTVVASEMISVVGALEVDVFEGRVGVVGSTGPTSR